MNNTKWNEIFRAFFELECSGDAPIEWMTKSLNGYIYGWESTWTHFGCEPADYNQIDWLKIRLTDENREKVLKILKLIHVPGEWTEDCVTIYGYRTDIEYI